MNINDTVFNMYSRFEDNLDYSSYFEETLKFNKILLKLAEGNSTSLDHLLINLLYKLIQDRREPDSYQLLLSGIFSVSEEKINKLSSALSLTNNDLAIIRDI